MVLRLVLVVEGVVDVDVSLSLLLLLLLLLSSHDDATSHSHISRPLPSIAAANTAPQDQRQRNEENNGRDNAKDAFSKAMAVPEPVVAAMVVVMEGVALEEVF